MKLNWIVFLFCIFVLPTFVANELPKVRLIFLFLLCNFDYEIPISILFITFIFFTKFLQLFIFSEWSTSYNFKCLFFSTSTKLMCGCQHVFSKSKNTIFHIFSPSTFFRNRHVIVFFFGHDYNKERTVFETSCFLTSSQKDWIFEIKKHYKNLKCKILFSFQKMKTIYEVTFLYFLCAFSKIVF